MTERRDFNAAAQQWDEEPRRVKLAGDIASAIQEHIHIVPEWDALDIGCGTGLVTLALAPLLHSMTGADSSEGMLERLTVKIRQSGMTNVHTELCDLAQGNIPRGKYHLITSAMTLHHIEKVEPLLQSLKTLLHPGGWLALADLESEDGSFHDDPTGIFHTGFSVEKLSGMLVQAGYSSVSVSPVTTVVKGERCYPVLLARAQLG